MYINYCSHNQPTYSNVKSHFKALGLYNFKRGFGWACKWVGLYSGGLINGEVYILAE